MKIIQSKSIPGHFFEFGKDEKLDAVSPILDDVRQHGDVAVKKYTRQFDKTDLLTLSVLSSEIELAYKEVDAATVKAMQQITENIRKFAEKQRTQITDFEYEIEPGVFTGQRVTPLERVGVYVPGGNFPLISTLLMGAIPATVAGVPEICVVSPPTWHGEIHPAILVAADIAGITEIYKIGGVQAIAALAYGTESIKRVDKIVGPGNKYVAQAKREVFGAVSIDMIAGPTEILIIADDSADPEIIAADLLAQAEHDVDARPVLITTSENLANAVVLAVKKQLQTLSTRATAEQSIENNGIIILVENLSEAAKISNRKAPEHLEIQVNEPINFSKQLTNFGSLFIGQNSAEVLGDYSSGLNHTLPTNTTARYRGGLSVYDFLKICTTLRTTETGLKKIGPVAETMGVAEGLAGHARSVRIRLDKLA